VKQNGMHEAQEVPAVTRICERGRSVAKKARETRMAVSANETRDSMRSLEAIASARVAFRRTVPRQQI